MVILTFNDVIRYLEGSYSPIPAPSIRDERTFRIEREKQILEMLSNPQNSYPIIHVAGSKGKGSTSAFIAGLATTGTNKIGLYTSPHVFSYKERWSYIQDTNKGILPFEESEYVRVANIMQDILKDHREIDFLKGGVPPTPFEMYTAFAFLLFKETNVNLAVIETGLGGRLDATNVVSPIATVLTHLELEHTNILGNTLEEITREKCGIIKNGTLVISAPQKKGAKDIITEVTKENSSLVKFLTNTEIESFSFIKQFLPTQRENLALAIKVAKELGFRHVDDDKEILDKVKNIALRGRAEIIVEGNSLIVLDGAHTKDSVRRLCEDVNSIHKCSFLNIDRLSPEVLNKPYSLTTKPKTKAVIFATNTEKDAKSMLEELIYEFDIICISSFTSEYKKCDSIKTLIELEKALNEHPNNKVSTIIFNEDPNACIKEVLETAQTDCTIVVTGSFYLLNEVLYDRD